jgi:hypothetical protein
LKVDEMRHKVGEYTARKAPCPVGATTPTIRAALSSETIIAVNMDDLAYGATLCKLSNLGDGRLEKTVMAGTQLHPVFPSSAKHVVSFLRANGPRLFGQDVAAGFHRLDRQLCMCCRRA